MKTFNDVHVAYVVSGVGEKKGERERKKVFFKKEIVHYYFFS